MGISKFRYTISTTLHTQKVSLLLKQLVDWIFQTMQLLLLIHPFLHRVKVVLLCTTACSYRGLMSWTDFASGEKSVVEFGTFKKLYVTCCSLKSDSTPLFTYFFNLILWAFYLLDLGWKWDYNFIEHFHPCMNFYI